MYCVTRMNNIFWFKWFNDALIKSNMPIAIYGLWFCKIWIFIILNFFENCQVLITFIEKPPICAVPFDPKIETDPLNFRTLAVVSIIPKAPLLNFKFTMTVQTIYLANAFMPYALTYFTLPINQFNISTWWLAWLPITPPSKSCFLSRTSSLLFLISAPLICCS